MLIHPDDNVEVSLSDGHKYAVRPIAAGESVIKYGWPIGHATRDIAPGEHVHSHNMATDLAVRPVYAYDGMHARTGLPGADAALTFRGWLRPDGSAGIRNDIWIVNTVGCVNKTAEAIAARTGAFAFPHPFGCSQLGDDHTVTRQILRGLVRHPNAGGVLVLGLGCENNHIASFREFLGAYDPDRVRFLNCQDAQDEIAEGVRLVNELRRYADTLTPADLPLSLLRVGLKCGGSDGFSGITANPLVGRFADRLIAAGGSCVLTEVPEMFGAEHLLMRRCRDREVFDRTVALINDFKDYYARHGQVCYENPSPGNKAGGITTLEEKSLGCVQKSGSFPVTDVLDYGDTVRRPGLSLLNGPGNDMVAVTNLTAAGCQLILFTTGRGTPLGAPVPTVKIASNTSLAALKPGWIDFDAGPAAGAEPRTLAKPDEDFFRFVLGIASGAPTKNELSGYREISIFKDGVTL